MDIDNQFFEVWAPDALDQRATAKLTFDSNRKPMIDVVHWGDPKPEFLSQAKIPVLHGDGRDRVTLVESRNFAHSSFFGQVPDVAQIEPRTIFVGLHLLEDDPEIRSIEFSMKGFTAWFRDQAVEFHADDAGNGHYTVRRPDARKIVLSNESSLEIRLCISVTSRFLDEEELSVKRKPWLRLTFTQPSRLDAALSSARKVQGFFEFVADGSLDFDQVFIYPDEQSGSYEVLAQWVKGSHTPRGGHSLVWFEALKDNWQPYLCAWWDLYDRIPFALDSYRACHRRPGQTLELRYLAIVGALEGFHRAFYDRPKIKLRERLEELSERYNDVLFYLLPKADAPRIVQTRDHIAHQTVFPSASLIPVEHRWAWFRRLVAVFELCVVSHLGFSAEQLEGVSTRRKSAIESGFMGEWDFTV